MIESGFHALRRRLALAGGHVAVGGALEAGSRPGAPEFRPATLIESPLRHLAVGAAAALTEPIGFLDGVQQSTVLGHVGTTPVLAARIAAGVRRRQDRVPHGAVALHRTLVVGRSVALSRLESLPDGVDAVVIDDDAPAHPIGDVDRARAVVDRERTALEIRAAAAYRRLYPVEWLVADGTLTVSPEWSSDARMVGVIKSHASLPFTGDELEEYLTLPAGHRSSLFIPATHQVTPVHSFGLRLRPWQDHDLLHGLVRVELAPQGGGAQADAIARWLLAERAPLANDPRQDRLLYGVHDVERWLRARVA